MTRNRSALAFAFVALVPSAALARESPLAGQPAVRHKFELRDARFELAPTFEATINADFRHTISGGIKAEYHLTDTISFGGMVLFGKNFNTGLMNQIVDSLPVGDTEDFPTPTQTEARQHANDMPLHGGLGVTLTPWFGKLSLFGSIFINYDIYISGGFGFAQTKNDFAGDDTDPGCDQNCDDGNPNDDRFFDPRNDGPHNAGFKPGIQAGAGLHLFFNRFMALDISVRDYFFTDNPSGFDFDGDFDVDEDDPRFMGHLFVGLGLSFYLPPKARISR